HPLPIYQMVRPQEARTRIEIEAQRGLTPFVGRARELALLRERFAEASDGRGQMVLLAGEAGVGKSRLLLEFRRGLDGVSATWLTGRSISFGQQIAYMPVIDLLKQYFRIEETDTQAVVLEKLERGLGDLPPEARATLPFVNLLLSANPSED